MTDEEKIRALVGYRLEQADEALRSAMTNLEHGLYRSAVNRAYYAMFYSVLALLATKARETSRHSGAIALFDRDFVKPGSLPRHCSRWLHDAFNHRQSADYSIQFELDVEGIRELIEQAEQFLAEIVGYLKQASFLHDA